MRDGKFISWKLEDYAKSFPGKPANDEQLRKRRIISVKITGDAAIAKLIFDYPTASAVDHMLMLKINGEWKIVNKIFQKQDFSKHAQTPDR